MAEKTDKEIIVRIIKRLDREGKISGLAIDENELSFENAPSCGERIYVSFTANGSVDKIET